MSIGVMIIFDLVNLGGLLYIVFHIKVLYPWELKRI